MEDTVLLDQKKEVEEVEEDREEKENNDGSKVEDDRAEKSEDDDGSKVEEDSIEKHDHDDGGEEEDDRAEKSEDDDDGSKIEEDNIEKYDHDDGCEEEEDDDDDDDDDDRSEDKHENDEDQDEIAEVVDKPKKISNLPVSPKENKQSDVLNLNNEVVKMRKEVKRVRALIIRKLTRKIGALKKKKGKDKEVERNQQRADRLLEEIHAMKNAAPDLVTKMALQKRLIFEQVCKNPKSTITERAIARIASHPQFDKKILAIKTAVRAFKEERMTAVNPKGKKKVQGHVVKVNPQSPDRGGEGESDEEGEESTEEQQKKTFKKNEEGVLKGGGGATVAKPEIEPVKAAGSAQTADVPKKETPPSGSGRLLPVKSSTVKNLVKDKPPNKRREKKPSVPQRTTNEEESDFESSDDEEKEYFDDSTEERFHKQSSQSEESDDDDGGFFVGKVRKFKKKNKDKVQESELGEKKKQEVKNDSTDKVRTEIDDLEARLKSKASMQSVFCSSLSRPVQNRGRGTDRGRGWGKFRGQGTMKGGPNRDFSRESKFPKQEGGTERNSGFKYTKPEGSQSQPERGFASFGRARGRGRGDVVKHKDHGGGGGFTHQAPKQALHPSWEASKKRKEQQGQIQAFQGKKIKFDDDD